MQNPIYRQHWYVVDNGDTQERYSYHKDVESMGKFVRETLNEHKGTSLSYSTIGPGKEVSAPNGRIYDMILHSTKLGFWDTDLASLELA